MLEKLKTEQYTYQVNKVNFVVTPVYKDRGETITAILLKRMEADTEQICAASTSLTRAEAVYYKCKYCLFDCRKGGCLETVKQ